MANFDYFKQYVSEMERIKAKTAHEEHIVEFRAMCAKMINDAIPEIKQQCVAACMEQMKNQNCACEKKPQSVDVRFNIKDIERQVVDAFRKVFK